MKLSLSEAYIYIYIIAIDIIILIIYIYMIMSIATIYKIITEVFVSIYFRNKGILHKEVCVEVYLIYRKKEEQD